jgi:hypothetical protein
MNPLRYTFLLLAFSPSVAAQRHAGIANLPQPSGAARKTATGPTSASLTGSGHWLLLYLSADQPLAGQTAHFIARLHADNPQARIVVLIDRPRILADQYVHDHAAAAIREWQPDADHYYWKALALSGSPVLMGMEDDRVIWRTEYLVAQNRPLQDQVAEWLKPQTAAQPPASVLTRAAPQPAPRPLSAATPSPEPSVEK